MEPLKVGKLRTIRILEYSFDSYQDMEDHFAQSSVPANGTKKFTQYDGTGLEIRSAMLVSPDFAIVPLPTRTED